METLPSEIRNAAFEKRLVLIAAPFRTLGRRAEGRYVGGEIPTGSDGFFSGAPVVQGGIKGLPVMPSLEARLEKMLSL